MDGDGKFCRKCWNDIVLTLHFSRWHLLQTPEARDLCLRWLWRGLRRLPRCCFMTRRPWTSPYLSLFNMSLLADNISIPQSLTALIVTPGEQDGAACTDASARASMTRMHNPKIHTCEADKGTERAKVRLQWKAVTFYFLSVCTCRSTFSSLGSILSLQTSGRWIVPSAARRSEFHFANLATLSFSHAKQHKFLSPPDPWIVNPSSVPRSRMLHGDLCKKKTFNKKKRKEQWNDKPLRDCGRLSRHEWARVTLPQAVSPSISGSVTSSQPRSAWCFFPAADERRWQEAWNALDLFIARRTAICLGTDAPLNSEMVG